MHSEYDVMVKARINDTMRFLRHRVKADNPHLAASYAKDDLSCRFAYDAPIKFEVLSVQKASDMDAANRALGIRQTSPLQMEALYEYVHRLGPAQRNLLRGILNELEKQDTDELTPT